MADTNFSDLSLITTPDPAFVLLLEDPSQPTGTSQFQRISCNDFAKLITKLITDKTIRMEETAGVTGASGQGMLYFDSSGHALKVSENNGTVDQVALLNKTQTFTATTLNSPTIVTPTIASNGFANATHNHSDSAHGGTLAATGVSAGPFRNANITIGADGRISVASDGSTDAFISLTDQATIATDASQGNAFKVTLGGNRTLGVPTNPTSDQCIIYRFIQDGTGSRTITLTTSAGGFNLGSSIPSVSLTPTAKACDYMTCIYSSAIGKWHVVGFCQGFVGAP